MNKYQQIAQKIAAEIPSENVASLENCMTRLRFTLNDKTKVDKARLSAIEGVLGLNESGEEFQIVIGPSAVNEVRRELDAIYKKSPAIGDGKKLHEQIRRKNATPFKLFLKKIAGIFLPLIPAFIACGLVSGILNIILKINPALSVNPLLQILGISGNAVFFALAILVGANSAKQFGGSPMLGGTLAAVISHPALSNVELFGAPLLPGRGGVIAVIMVAAFAAFLEKRLHKIVPEMLDLFLTPLLVILISSFAAIFALQPIGGIISEGIGAAAAGAIEQGGAVTGFILGASFLPLVMTGLHQGLTPIHADLLANTGKTILLPVLAMAGAGQVGASFAVYLKTKNKFLKKTIATALPVGIMGVGEPLIYGVTLPLGKPFAAACIGGALGGAVQAYFGIGSNSIGISGLPLTACTDNMALYLLGLGTAYIGGFVAAYLIGFSDPPEKE
jgi:PTS system sucrose-specific IIC component